MNLKSNILKISVVIALIFILIPAIAAEDIDQSTVDSVEQDDVISEDVTVSDDALTADSDDDSGVDEDSDDAADESEDGSYDETDEETADEYDDENDVTQSQGVVPATADLKIAVASNANQVKVGDLVFFAIVVYNNGPNLASNVIVHDTLLSGDVLLLSAIPSQGYYDPVKGTWYVGDLEPGKYAVLSLVGKVLSDKDIILVTTVTSDAIDPNPEDNLAICFVDVVYGEEVAVETLPATGNPIALALLALISIVGVSLRRKL